MNAQNTFPKVSVFHIFYPVIQEKESIEEEEYIRRHFIVGELVTSHVCEEL